MTELSDNITKRINALRKKVLDVNPSICTERAFIYTEIYKKNESKPVIIRRALALKEVLKKNGHLSRRR